MAKCRFKFYQRYFLTPNQIRNMFLWLHCMTESLYIYMLFKVYVGVKQGNVLSKNVKFLLFVQHTQYFVIETEKT